MKRVKAYSVLPFAAAMFFAASFTMAHEHEKAAGAKDIVATAVEAGSFNTLAKALVEAGLVDALKAKGPFTVFAPTDKAFDKLPKGTLESLLKDKEALKKVLLYHVVQGEVSASDAAGLTEATTLSGQVVKIKSSGKKIKINNASVTQADVAASNGVIHVIDTVLLPK